MHVPIVGARTVFAALDRILGSPQQGGGKFSAYRQRAGPELYEASQDMLLLE